MLAGCGSSGSSASGNAGLSPHELVDKAAAAVSSASAVHVFGTTLTDLGKTEVHVDVHLSPQAASGRVRVRDRTLRLLRVGSDFYFRANDAYWKSAVPREQLREVLRKVHGKWLHIPADAPKLAKFSAFLSWDKLQKSFGTSPADAHYDRGPANVVRGVDTVSAIDRDSRAIIFVPEEGPPLPIEISEGQFNATYFDDWNVPVHVRTPPPDQVVGSP